MRTINIALQRSAVSGLDIFRNPTQRVISRAIILLVLLAATISPRAQEPSAQSSKPEAAKSEFIAPGIEHLQITRGYKSDKEATGPWFINMLRLDLTKARLRMVHAMDEAVGLETVSSMATRYGALAAVNSGYFGMTGAYRWRSVGIAVLSGILLRTPDKVRAVLVLIERH